MYKVIVCQKKEATLNHWNESFLKRIPAITFWRQHQILACCWSFFIGLNENANSFFATRCLFETVKIAVSPVTLYTKQHCAQTLLYQALQAWWNGNETNRTNHCRLTSHKWGVMKNESLSELFGNRWANKVKIKMHIIRQLNSFLTLHAC